VALCVTGSLIANLLQEYIGGRILKIGQYFIHIWQKRRGLFFGGPLCILWSLSGLQGKSYSAVMVSCCRVELLFSIV